MNENTRVNRGHENISRLNNIYPMEELIERAAAFAKETHAKGKPRKFSHEPYFIHPEAVAKRLHRLIDPDVQSGKLSRDDYEAMMAAAYLHDVVEDCKVPIQELENRFGSVVAKLVAELTSDEKAIEGMMMAQHIDKHDAKGYYLTEEINHMSVLARVIKFIDREHNVMDLASVLKTHKAWVEGYSRETKYILDHIAIDPSPIERQLIESISQRIAPYLKIK